tara:strand:- start:500 stop:703 length:204 start_codon:yes stop_codon:yes gene_type:complete
MTNSHPWRSLTLKQIYANTAALRRIRKQLESDLFDLSNYDPIVQMDAYQSMVDANIEEMAETNNWSK